MQTQGGSEGHKGREARRMHQKGGLAEYVGCSCSTLIDECEAHVWDTRFVTIAASSATRG